MVGVSNRSGSPVAVAWAWDLAQRLNVPLVAVRAYRRPGAASSAFMGTRSLLKRTPQRIAEETNAALIKHVVESIGDEAGHKVVYRVVEGDRRQVLVDSSRNAALLVIDSPPQRRVSADPSFRQSLLLSAKCPVVSMPPRVAGY